MQPCVVPDMCQGTWPVHSTTYLRHVLSPLRPRCNDATMLMSQLKCAALNRKPRYNELRRRQHYTRCSCVSHHLAARNVVSSVGPTAHVNTAGPMSVLQTPCLYCRPHVYIASPMSALQAPCLYCRPDMASSGTCHGSSPHAMMPQADAYPSGANFSAALGSC